MRLSPHPFTLRQLQYAAAVAEARSFRRAAEACHVSQPSLSAQIAELESAIGVRLFERDHKTVLVTRAGEQLLARARRILVEADDLAEAAARVGDPLEGTLRVGVIPTISSYLLPTAVKCLKARFPKLTVLWTEERTKVLVEQIRVGDLDAAVLALEADIGDLEHARIAVDRFVLATPRTHPLARSSTPVKASELQNLRFLLLDEGHCLRDQALAVCGMAGANEREFRATSLSTLAQMVSAGAGVTLLPELALATESRRSELAWRPLSDVDAVRTIVLVWRKSSPLGPSLRAVAAALADGYPRTALRERPAEGR